MYSLIRLNIFTIITGVEGLEPPTPGFGVWCSAVRATRLLYFPMYCMFSTKGTIFTCFESLLALLIFRGHVIPILALFTRKCDLRAHYSITLVTTPAPTVLPPSRIANREPTSNATVVISSTSRLALSPGIIISIPSCNLTEPVTSVVRI